MRGLGYSYISIPQSQADIILRFNQSNESIKGFADGNVRSADAVQYLYTDHSIYKLNLKRQSVVKMIDMKDEKMSQFYKIKSMNYIENTNQIEVMVRMKAYSEKAHTTGQQDFDGIEEMGQVRLLRFGYISTK